MSPQVLHTMVARADTESGRAPLDLDAWLQPVDAAASASTQQKNGLLFAARTLPALAAGRWASCGDFEFRAAEFLPEEDVAQAVFLLSGGVLGSSEAWAQSWVGDRCFAYSLRTPAVVWVARDRQIVRKVA